jgi:hypothetical protein
MKKDLIKFLSAVFVGVGLLVLYLVFLERFSIIVDLSNLTLIESIILYSQILRAIVLLVLGLRYQVQPIVPIIVFSFEALLIPPLLVLIILTGAPFYATFMGTILTAWFGATALVLTPYTIYGFARGLARDNSLSGAIVVASLELISVLFLSNLLLQSNTAISGLTGLGTQIISQIRSEVGAGGVPNSGGDASSSIGLVIFFVGMLFYMTLGTSAIRSKGRLPWILVVPLVGTLIAFVWTFQIAEIQTDILLVLTAPSMILFFAIWGTARGK